MCKSILSYETYSAYYDAYKQHTDRNMCATCCFIHCFEMAVYVFYNVLLDEVYKLDTERNIGVESSVKLKSQLHSQILPLEKVENKHCYFYLQLILLHSRKFESASHD